MSWHKLIDLLLTLASCIFILPQSPALAAIDDVQPQTLPIPSLPLSKTPALVFENQLNNAFAHESFTTRVKHYEVPLRLVDSQILEEWSAEMRDFFTFKRDGEQWFRWIINPASRSSHILIEEMLAYYKLDTKQKTFYRGSITASRSVILQNPLSKKIVSVKVSTDRLFTLRSQEKIEYRNMHKEHEAPTAKTDFNSSTILMTMLAVRPPRTFLAIPEIGYFTLDSKRRFFGREIVAPRRAMSVRSADYVLTTSAGRHYLPAFAVMHETFGPELAKQSGFPNVETFLVKKVVRPLARAQSELALFYGVTMDSPHFQNILFEFDPKTGQLTGKVAIRDLGDLYYSKTFLDFYKIPTLVRRGLQIERSKLLLEFWPLGATLIERNAPSWMTPTL